MSLSPRLSRASQKQSPACGELVALTPVTDRHRISSQYGGTGNSTPQLESLRNSSQTAHMQGTTTNNTRKQWCIGSIISLATGAIVFAVLDFALFKPNRCAVADKLHLDNDTSKELVSAAFGALVSVSGLIITYCYSKNQSTPPHIELFDDGEIHIPIYSSPHENNNGV